MSLLSDDAHPAKTNLASSVSLAPLAPGAVCDSPPPPACAGAGIGVGGGPADAAPDPALLTRERQAAFLATLAASGQVRSAAAQAGVSHQTAYRERQAAFLAALAASGQVRSAADRKSTRLNSSHG